MQILFLLSLLALQAPEDVIQHKWNWISYPSIPAPAFGKDQVIRVSVKPSGNPKKPALRFDFRWVGPTKPPPPVKAKNLNLRLHYPDGKIVEPGEGQKKDWEGGFGDLDYLEYLLIYTFPWGSNRLEEAWFELRIEDRTYWIEVPYGFTRNPADPKPPDRLEMKEPHFAPAMKKLGEKDHLVAWNEVMYQLKQFGKTKRHLTVYQANPFDSETRLHLISNVDLHEPRTSVQIQQDYPHKLTGRCVKLEMDDNYSVGARIDTFKFNRNTDKGRDWGKLHVTVGEEKVSVTMPSSLFRYVHGVTDPYHKKLIRVDR